MREAVDQFSTPLIPKTSYFVVTFADRPHLLADTTQSLATIQSKLGAIEPKGNTALADAIYLSLKKLHSAKYQRKALVIISDGGDNFSRYSLREVKKLRARVGCPDLRHQYLRRLSHISPAKLWELTEHWLSQVTDTTGGRTIVVDNAAKIPDAASRISLELRSQYVIGYRPTNAVHDGKWRKIRVRVASRHRTPCRFTLRLDTSLRNSRRRPL